MMRLFGLFFFFSSFMIPPFPLNCIGFFLFHLGLSFFFFWMSSVSFWKGNCHEQCSLPLFFNILMEESIEYSYLHDTQTPYP